MILADKRSEFDDLFDLYQDKKVIITGKVTLHNGNPQIVISSPDQIKVIK